MSVPMPKVTLRPVRNWAARLRHATTSKDAFREYVCTEGNARVARHPWSNEDLKPSPRSMINWRWYNFCIFWFGMGFGNWTLGSSVVAIGLNWYQASFVILCAAVISGTCMAFNSRAASTYHIGYPVVARSAFGMYGHYWPVACRGFCAMLWVSVILFQGGAYVSTMLTCIFGHRWKDLPAHFPDSVGTTVQRFLGYFLFWCITLPFCAFRPNRLRWLYDFKAVVLPPSVLGLLIYCLVQSRGRLADTLSLADAGTTVPRGATLGWLFVHSVNSSMGNWSTFIANMPDFSRYATSPRATFWTHILLVPIPATLGGMIGIFGTSALQRAWGVTLWNQWDLLDAILARSWTAPARFAVFLLAFSTALFTLGALVGANLLPFGSDSTALFPRYFNITRGMFFCCVVAFGLVPWKILASANGFLAFLGGYGIFMGPTAAIMISDYWIVRKGNIDIAQLYTSAPGSAYMYTGGFNLNAIAAYLCGMIIPFTGFVGTFGVTVPPGAAKLMDLGWIVSTSVTFVVYVVLCRLRPLENVDRSWAWEQLAHETVSTTASSIGDPEKVVGDGDESPVVEVPVYVGEEESKGKT